MSESFSYNEDVSSDTNKSISFVKREIFSFVWSINQFGKFLDRKYEFSSPTFSQNKPNTSKWIATVFSQNAYPQGSQVAFRIQNASSDSRCYSVMYKVMLIDVNGKHHELQTTEKIFRYYLDYDEFPLTSNYTIREKRLLQKDDSLSICCELDILVCDNPNTTTSDSKSLQVGTNVASETLFSSMYTDQKSNECESRMNILQPENHYLRKINDENLVEETYHNSNTWKKFDMNFQRKFSEIKRENNQNRKDNIKKCNVRVVVKDESGRSLCSPPKNRRGNLDISVNKTREKYKLETDSLTKSFEILSSDLSFLFTTKYQYDVTIHTEDGRIGAHKAILAARSDYFRRTLMPGDNEIHTEGINTTTMNTVLYYMYSGQRPHMTFDLAMDVLTACSMFHLEHLGEITQESLKSQANANNVTDILRKAKELKLDDLKISALQFVARNREAVTKSPMWNQMIDNDPHSAGEILLTIAAFRK